MELTQLEMLMLLSKLDKSKGTPITNLKEYRTSFTLMRPEYFNAFPRK